MAHVAAAVERIDRNVVPDLPDRVIAATALVAGAALVSRDAKIRASQIQTIW
jgi:predicted nucleic acid-binding protein